MAYGYNKTGQKSGDIIAAVDPQSNTKISFSNDRIDFVVSGSVIASVIPSELSASSFTVNELVALTTISASQYVGVPGQFTPTADGVPYFGSSSAASVLSPPTSNRNSYVLGWVNNQLAWVIAGGALSLTSAQFAEIAIDGTPIVRVETIYIESGTIS